MEFFRSLLASDIPFARDDAHRMLPSMIACLIGFAALLLALAVSLNHSLSMQERDVSGVVQVEIPSALAAKPAMLDRVLATIRGTPGVEELVLLREDDMETLLKPWLGNDFTLAGLPVPNMIDVKTTVKDGHTVVDVPALQRNLKVIDIAITVEDRGPWVSQMTRAAALLQSLVIIVAALLLACVGGMVVLVARTNLKLHFKAVSLLHMFGATDEYILRQFQWNNAFLAARGALIGAALAALIFFGWVLLSHRWDSPLLPPVDFTSAHGMTFLLLPLATALLAFVATRLTVQSMLRHMP